MGAIIATVILSGRAIAPLAKVGQTLGRANTALQARQNLMSFLSSEFPDYRDDNTGIASSDDSIDIVNVTLKLSDLGRPFFNDLNVKIKKGEKVAIVGRSGSGKSTLLKLCLGLLTPETGTVIVNGKDVREYKRSGLFQTVGTVFQDPWLFSGTLRENVGLGYDNCDDEKICECLVAAGQIFGTDPDSIDLDFIINDQGKNLSGGQKQAVTLARSLAFDPKTMLLDEPTSGMDVKTEAVVIEGIKRLCSEKTMVIITHKVSLVSLCQRVIVMEQGKIIWDDTIEKYIELIKTQQKKNG
jgi:ATP-binding cassette subfamily C protein LapB